MRRRFVSGWAVLLLLPLATLILADLSSAQDEAEHGYIGVDGCKICHKSAKKGDQYGKWLEGPHAGAYKTLASEEAAAFAAERGLEGSPQEIDECLRCHVTAHGAKAELLGKKYDVKDGVGCESCHGPGADYKSKKVMESLEASVAAGLIVPSEETCLSCHNEDSPSFDGFVFEEMWAQIAHPRPAEAEEAAEGK